jgi:hypothetical protein
MMRYRVRVHVPIADDPDVIGELLSDLVATQDHFALYYRQRQYGTDEQVLTSDGWGRAASAIKRFYEGVSSGSGCTAGWGGRLVQLGRWGARP